MTTVEQARQTFDVFKVWSEIKQHSFNTAKRFDLISDVEDIEQDVAAALFKQLKEDDQIAERLQDPETLTKIIKAQLRRECRKYFDRQNSKTYIYRYSKEYVIENWFALSAGLNEQIEDNEPEHVPGIRGIDILADFNLAVRQLTDIQREDLFLCNLQSLTPAENAKRHRALNALVRILNRQVPFQKRTTQLQEEV